MEKDLLSCLVAVRACLDHLPQRAAHSSSPEALAAVVSELEKARAMLDDSITLAQAVLDATIDGIVTIDSTGVIDAVNPAIGHLFGYTAAELVGQNVTILMPSPYREEHDSYITRYLETGEKRIIGLGREVKGRRKDGSTFPVELKVSEVVVQDRHLFVGTVRDVSARSEAESALGRERRFATSLVETAQAIVLVLDPEGKILRFNPFMEALTGYRLAEVVGADWFTTFIPEGERQRIREVFAAALEEGKVHGIINAILTRDGRELEIEWSATILNNERGEIVGLLSTGLDVTERRQLEAQFLQSQKMEAIGRLAGGVAHDFNTLLGTITGYSELLCDELGAQQPLCRHAEQIHRAAQRGADLTRQLLTFSRRHHAETQAVDLAAVLEEMGPMVTRLIGEDIEVGYRIKSGLGAVEANPSQLEQVILNLIVNAGDAMPHGGRVTMALDEVELAEDERGAHGLAAGLYLRLAISDTGVGMDAETRKHIFDPFYTTKEVGKGTGLGLSTAYGIVHGLQGKIDVESSSGRGSTFTIYLPQREAEEVERAASPAAGRLRGGAETVLLVEDDNMFRGLLEEVLAGRGYRVLAAGNPAQARKHCEVSSERIDLLISDVVMPGSTGPELAQFVVDRHPGAKVILMSGYSDDALAQREVAPAEADAFLQKPFGTKHLVQRVREVLDGGV